jgi:predicted RNA-binding Zn ribbon-like protein
MAVVPVERTYSRIAGHVVLDLINTVSWRLDATERTDNLRGYDDVLEWAAQTGVLSESERRTLRRQAKTDPAAAERELGRLRQLREIAYAALVESVDSAADELLRQQRTALDRTRLVNEEGRWIWKAEPLTLGAVADRAVREAIGLLTSPQLERLHQCEDVACGWVYLDMSPRRNRRWCVAEDCGNRNRARAFYARRKAAR